MKEKEFPRGKEYGFALGSDHAGFHLKEKIKSFLLDREKTVYDVGVYNTESINTAPIAEQVGRLVSRSICRQGILICGTGLGMSMAVNKVFGIRAALCHNQFTTALARQHNNANVLVLGSRVIAAELALECVKVWMKEKFLAGKYAERLKYLEIIEGNSCRNLASPQASGPRYLLSEE